MLPEPCCPPNIVAMHDEFQRLTGAPLMLDAGRVRSWMEFLKHRKPPFTIGDLITVVMHLKDQIRIGKRFPGCLKFSNLILRPDLFEEELGMITARSRPAKPVPARSVTVNKVTRILPPDPAGVPAVPIAVYIKALRDAANNPPKE